MRERLRYADWGNIFHMCLGLTQLFFLILWSIFTYYNYSFYQLIFILTSLSFMTYCISQLLFSVTNPRQLLWSTFPKYKLRFNDLADENDMISSGRMGQIEGWLIDNDIEHKIRTIDDRKFWLPINEYWYGILFKNLEDATYTKLVWFGNNQP